MPSETKYRILKEIHDEEIAGTHQLTTRLQLFFGVWTFITGAIGFKLDAFLSYSNWWLLVLVFITMGSLFGALLFIILGLRMHHWEGVCDVYQVVNTLSEDEEEISDEEFFEDRLADIAVAYERNSQLNIQRGNHLNRAICFIIGSVVLELAIFSLYSIR